MSYLELFSKLLGLSARDAEDALDSERAARLVLSRRVFLGSAGAASAAAMLSAGTVYSFAPAPPMSSVHLIVDGEIVRRWMPGELIHEFTAGNSSTAHGALVELRRLSHMPAPMYQCWLPPCPARHRPMQRPGVMWLANPGESIRA